MAPMSLNFFNHAERYEDIDIGVFDYVLRCIDGPYLDKYLHIKQTPQGEIIGGAPRYDMIKNPSRLTLYIENAEL